MWRYSGNTTNVYDVNTKIRQTVWHWGKNKLFKLYLIKITIANHDILAAKSKLTWKFVSLI